MPRIGRVVAQNMPHHTVQRDPTIMLYSLRMRAILIISMPWLNGHSDCQLMFAPGV
jgi:hypothetical protein